MGRKFCSKWGDAILNAVADGIEIFEYGCYQPSALMRYGLEDLKILEKERARSHMRAEICRLQKRKYLEKIKHEEKIIFKLSDLGQKMLDRQHVAKPKKLPEGETFVISYDIPEKYAAVRQDFRRTLKRLGFKKLQQSVWSSELDWSDRTTELIDSRALSDWVLVRKMRLCIDVPAEKL